MSPSGGCTRAGASPPPAAAAPTAGRDSRHSQWAGRPVKIMAAELAERFGLQLTAARSLRERKVTASLPADIPAADVLEALAVALEARWVRPAGEAETRRLEYRPEVEAALREGSARRERLEQAARQEQAELIHSAMREALLALDRPPPPSGQRPYVQSEPLVRLLSSLGPAALEELASAVRFSVPYSDTGSAPDKTPALCVPFTALSPMQQGFVHQYFQQQGITADPTGSLLSFWNLDGEQLLMSFLPLDGGPPGPPSEEAPVLRGDAPVLLAETGPAAEALQRLRAEPLGGASPGGSGLANAEEQAAFIAEVAEALRRLDSRCPGRHSARWLALDLAEASLALGEALGVPVVADYFTLEARLSLEVRDVAASELVWPLLRQFGLQPVWSGDVLVLRSIFWAGRAEREIPEEFLDGLVEARRRLPDPSRSVLPLPELAAAAAALRPEQLGGLTEFRTRDASERLSFELESQAIRLERPLLLFYDALGLEPRARERLLGEGLPLGEAARAGRAFEGLMEGYGAWLLARDDWRRLRVALREEQPTRERGSPFLPLELEFRDPHGALLWRRATEIFVLRAAPGR
jgi:hypothetical protein